MDSSSDRLNAILREILDFRERRDWKQFHNPKNLAVSISLESNELLEHFQWKNMEESLTYLKQNKEKLSEEAADILVYLLYFCNDAEIDLLQAVEDKIEKNNKKYPVEKSKGKSTKYTELN